MLCIILYKHTCLLPEQTRINLRHLAFTDQDCLYKMANRSVGCPSLCEMQTYLRGSRMKLLDQLFWTFQNLKMIISLRDDWKVLILNFQHWCHLKTDHLDETYFQGTLEKLMCQRRWVRIKTRKFSTEYALLGQKIYCLAPPQISEGANLKTLWEMWAKHWTTAPPDFWNKPPKSVCIFILECPNYVPFCSEF